MQVKKTIFSLLFLLCACLCLGQNTDSLWNVYKDKSQVDSNRIKALNAIGSSFEGNNPDSAILLAGIELEFVKKFPKEKQNKWVADAYKTLGSAYINKDNNPKARECFLKALEIHLESGNKKGMAACYNNIGISYEHQANFPKALEFALKSLKLKEEIGDKKGIANCFNNIGLIYSNQNNKSKALEYYFKSLEIKKEIGNKKGIINSYSNLASAYSDMERYDSSLIYSLKSLEIIQEIKDVGGMATCYSIMAITYKKKKDYASATEYYLKAIKILREIGQIRSIGNCYVDLGEIYFKQHIDINKSIQNYKYGLEVSRQVGDIDLERKVYDNLAQVYASVNKFKEAYENHVKYKALTDSIFNDENSKQLGDMKTQFEVEKKEAELKVKSEAEQEKLKALAAEEKKRQNVIIGAVAGVLILVVVFSLFLLNRFRITQRQKTIIEKQKGLVDAAYEQLHEKNKEVMDSIFYARRIQNALLPNESYISKSFSRLRK